MARIAADVTGAHSHAGRASSARRIAGAARGHLAEAREPAGSAVARAVLPALLPVALVPAMLARMERADDDPFAPK